MNDFDLLNPIMTLCTVLQASSITVEHDLALQLERHRVITWLTAAGSLEGNSKFSLVRVSFLSSAHSIIDYNNGSHLAMTLTARTQKENGHIYSSKLLVPLS